MTCKRCGSCCKNMQFEIDKGDTVAEIQWVLKHWHRNDNGNYDCDLLGINGLCKDYENRPSMCRKYKCQPVGNPDEAKEFFR